MAKIVVPLANGFEDSEFTVPCERLRASGHEIVVVGTEAGATVRGKRGKASATIEQSSRQLDPREFDALVIPGGYSPDHLRLDRDLVSFVRRFVQSGKLVAAVCHGPKLLVEADVVRGRTMTSCDNMITSRKPEYLAAFSEAILHRLEAPAAATAGRWPGPRTERPDRCGRPAPRQAHTATSPTRARRRSRS